MNYLGTHRLVPSKFGTGSVLESLPLPASVLADLSELDAASNERKIAEAGGSPGIGPGELLYGVPEAHIVNAVFTHPGPYGGRFHGSRRGAWYAGLEIETSIAEVSFHKRRFLENARITGEYPFDYIDFLADFSGLFHGLDSAELADCLQPEPIPQCYAASQVLANKLLYEGSNGILYPSVRNPSGTCMACFRPALVFHPRQASTYRITIQRGKKTIAVEHVSSAV
ncbi:MAG: RES family NAD+ phosphorylase [Bryobacteraceae bacterium]